MLCVTVNEFAANSNSNRPENSVPRHRKASLLANAVHPFLPKRKNLPCRACLNCGHRGAEVAAFASAFLVADGLLSEVFSAKILQRISYTVLDHELNHSVVQSGISHEPLLWLLDSAKNRSGGGAVARKEIRSIRFGEISAER
jgi:hypothetical protein